MEIGSPIKRLKKDANKSVSNYKYLCIHKNIHNKSMLNNAMVSTLLRTNPCEIQLEALFNRTLKHRVFRGLYVERRYVEDINGYRDVVSLHKSEKSLDKALREMRDKLQLVNRNQKSEIWIGITSNTLRGITNPQRINLDTYLWVDIDLPLGEYWFIIKTISFLDNEIILTLEEVAPVEADEAENEENLDALLLLKQWLESIKQTVYNFMSQDIRTENIKAAFVSLRQFVLPLIPSAFLVVKYLLEFSLRLLSEINRTIEVLMPIILKLIDLFAKIIEGLFKLLAAIGKYYFGDCEQRKRIIHYRDI